VAQVEECLLYKHKALSSNHNLIKIKNTHSGVFPFTKLLPPNEAMREGFGKQVFHQDCKTDQKAG
jgi:hypothetical protein